MAETGDQGRSQELISKTNGLARQVEATVRNTIYREFQEPRPDVEERIKMFATDEHAKRQSELLGEVVTPQDIEQDLRLAEYARRQFREATFFLPDDSMMVQLGYGAEPVVRSKSLGIFYNAPQSFRFPGVSLAVWSEENPQPIQSPIGELLQSYIADKNKRLYIMENSYFLNAFDQAVRYEEVQRVRGERRSLEEAIAKDAGDPKKVFFYDGVLSEDMSRYMPMTEQEYEQLSGYITQIQNRKARQVR